MKTLKKTESQDSEAGNLATENTASKMRIQLDLSLQSFERLKELQGKLGHSTRTKTIRAGLASLEILAKYWDNDCSLLLVMPDGTQRELEIVDLNF